MRKTIQVFEFDEIKQGRKYDGETFEAHELLAIQKYNTVNKNKYFTLTHNGVKYKNYVGVLQVGKLTIEILFSVYIYQLNKKYKIVYLWYNQCCFHLKSLNILKHSLAYQNKNYH